VEKLANGLRGRGVRTWTDLENIRAGQAWEAALEKGLNGASGLILVLSKDSTHSASVMDEMSFFLEQGRPVIPLVIDDDAVANAPLRIRRIQWVDFRGDFDSALNSLAAAVVDLQRSSPVETPSKKSKGYLFISYADEDTRFVDDLKAFMKEKGYGYWDFRESDRNYQADYSLELEGIIKNAAGTLSVVSPDWKRSATAFQELHFSREVGTPVFLLKVRDPGPTLAIAGITFIDFLSQPTTGFKRLEEEMRRKGL
jgi:hypothetical protein